MTDEAITTIADSTLFDSLNSEPEEPHYILSENDNYFTNETLFQGKQGEEIILAAFKINYKAKDGYVVEHNNFSSEYEYSCGSGADGKLRQGCKEKARYEVKNLSPQKKPYGTDFARKKILPRLARSGGGLGILFITFLSLLTRKAIDLIEQEGNIIIEIGEVLTSDFYRNLKKLYTLGNRIHKAITNFWKTKSQPKASQPLFSTPINQLQLLPDTSNVTVNANSTITRTHDTPTVSYGEYVKEFEVEMVETKKRETERLRFIYGG